MSASVQCVAMRTTRAPRSYASSSSSTVRSRKEQHGEPRRVLGRDPRGLLDQRQLVDEAQAVVERRSSEAVAVRDLDHADARLDEPAGHGRDLFERELVRDRVRSVAQGHVDEGD